MRRRKGLKAQMRDWNHHSREMRAAAAPPRHYDTLGRRFTVTAWFWDGETDKANDWLAQNPGHGVITVTRGRILIAHKDDEGRLLTRLGGTHVHS